MKKRLHKFRERFKRKKHKSLPGGAAVVGELENVPRITNDQVAQHREEILGKARKYIYPLQHSKHRIVIISSAITISAILTFLVLCVVNLYKFQTTSTFYYRVSQVVPFPVARIGRNFVSYENYLFELRHYMHYYHEKQDVDFSDPNGQRQLDEFKKRALDRVIDDAYITRIAKEKGIKVSQAEIDKAIARLRDQNRIVSDQALADVLKDYWGWTVQDYRRSLQNQLLSQKVVAALDTETRVRAENALQQLRDGKNFAELASEVSDDQATKGRGGDFGTSITENNRDIPAETIETMFTLKSGEYSGLVNIGTGLEIIMVNEVNGNERKASHILFSYKDISTFLNDIKEQSPARVYLKLK